jgi:hypothetical protein
MSTTPETKVAEQLTNLMESHWFNSSIFGRYMADQPFYTIDRTMEMVTQLIRYISKRAEHDTSITSDGIRLAVELESAIKAIRELESFDNLRLPKSAEELAAQFPRPTKVAGENRSWVKDRYDQIQVSSIQ